MPFKVVYSGKCSSQDVIVKALRHDHFKMFDLGLMCCCCCCLKEYFLNVDSSLSKPNEDRSRFSKLVPFAYIEKVSTSVLCESLLLPDTFQ